MAPAKSVPRALSARSWLTLLVTAALVPIFVLAGFLVWRVDRTASQAYERRALALALQTSAALDRDLVAFQASLQALASSPAIQRNNWAEFYEQAQALQAVRGAVIVVRDANGQQIINTRVPLGTKLPRASNDMLAASDALIFKAGQPQMTDLFSGTLSSSTIVAMDVPIFRNGSVAYAMSMGLPVKAMEALLKAQDPPQGWTMAILDGRNRIVARSTQHDDFVGKLASDKIAGSIVGSSGVFTGSAVGGPPMLSAYAQSNIANWHVIVDVPASVVRSSVWSTTSLVVIGIGLAVVVAALSTYAFARAVSGPIGGLMQAAEALGRGETPELIRSTLKEANSVGNALAVASFNLRAREEHLLEERRRSDALAKVGASLVGQRDIEKAVRTVLDAAMELTGASFGAFFYNTVDEEDRRLTLYTLAGATQNVFDHLPMPRHTDVFAPTFAGGTIIRSDDITKDPRYGKNAPFAGMPPGHLPIRSYLGVPVEARSGEPIGALLLGHEEPERFSVRHADLIAGVAGQAAFAIDNANLFEAAQRELGARRRSEDDLRLVAGELEHRIKNMLAMIAAIANQTFRTASTKESAKETFETRLGALAQAQDILTATSWSSAPLRKVVEGALAPHRMGQNRLRVNGPDLLINAKQALSLSLAIHELATNAVKYGALSNEAGYVDIQWTIDGQEPDAQFRLLWREAGGPVVATPSRKGFGSRLIERTLAVDFGGTVETEYEQSGFVCRMTAPAAHLQSGQVDASSPPPRSKVS